MRTEKKIITQYLEKGTHCILVPVYYDGEEKPAWRNVFVGTYVSCLENLNAFPDYYEATLEQNAEHKRNKAIADEFYKKRRKIK